MKKILLAAAGLLAVAHLQPAAAQTTAPCDLKGIYTDPAYPAVNPEYAPRTNTFNWYYGQQGTGRYWNLNSQAQPNATAIWLPWEQSDNTSMTHILGKRDLPKDGWELVKRNLGYRDDGTPYPNLINPYVVLYNKRSGMLRVFVAIGERAQDYNYAEIKLFFNGAAGYKAGTLNHLEGLGVALENTLPGVEASTFSAVTRFLNQDTKWFMADFPMEYDPCACQFTSKLVVEVNLIDKADIKLTGTTTGTLLAVDKAAGTSSTSSDFDKAIAVTKNVNGVLKKSQSTFKTISGYTSSVLGTLTAQGAKSNTQDADNKKTAFGQLMNALGTNSFLKNGLNSLPYVGAAVSILDSFIGGGKEESGPQAVTIQPMSISMTTSLTGTLSATREYENITFNNPGTRTITTPEEYPYYNEAMGVFSLIRKPIVERRVISTTDANGSIAKRYEYHVKQALQYVVNRASGFEVQDFQVALLQEGANYPDILPAGWLYEGIAAYPDGNQRHTFRTAYVGSGCLTNQTFALETADPKYWGGSSQFATSTGSTIYLKFMLNLRPIVSSATTQNMLLVLKYPVTIMNVTSFTASSQPCLAVQPQLTAAEIQTFCTSSVYQAATALPRTAPGAGTPPAKPQPRPDAGFELYPNPTTDVATVRFAGSPSDQPHLYLTDMIGRQVLAISSVRVVGEQVLEASFSTAVLAPGIYQCVLEDAAGARTARRLNVVR